MARIHRDGQKRPVFIYRLLTSGTIDEKIFQRAITKMGLSESLIGETGGAVAESSKGDSFSQSDVSAPLMSILLRRLIMTFILLPVA